MSEFLCNHKFAHVDAFSQNKPCHVIMMTTFRPAPFPSGIEVRCTSPCLILRSDALYSASVYLIVGTDRMI